jgi:hypothetical protein
LLLPILVASSATRFKLFTPAPMKALSMFGAYEQIVQDRTVARSAWLDSFMRWYRHF